MHQLQLPAEISSTSPLPPCPWCHNGHWQKLSGDHDDNPHPDNPDNRLSCCFRG